MESGMPTRQLAADELLGEQFESCLYLTTRISFLLTNSSIP
jgi:hypothetical protein